MKKRLLILTLLFNFLVATLLAANPCYSKECPSFKKQAHSCCVSAELKKLPKIQSACCAEGKELFLGPVLVSENFKVSQMGPSLALEFMGAGDPFFISSSKNQLLKAPLFEGVRVPVFIPLRI